MNSNRQLAEEIKTFFKGDVEYDEKTLEANSRDASLFRVKPQVVVHPKDSEDIEKLVSYINDNRDIRPHLAIAGRAAGTDMTGGPLTDGIVVSFTKYMNVDSVDFDNMEACVEPGVFYRDFEKETLPEHISLPIYPASKNMAALGGMIMNNCGGEKTLRYGQIREFVNSVTMVMADGKEYSFHPLNKMELDQKKGQNNFEGKIYRETFNLLDKHYDLIKQAKPHVTKNSAGYALWRVWDKEKQVFDLSQLFVGSQGTLGLMTRAHVRLVETKEHTRMITLFFKNWDALPAVVNDLLPHDVESMEAFDDTTIKLGLRFMPEIAKKVGKSFISFAWQFLPEVFVGIRMLRMPKLIVLVELAEDDVEALDKKEAKILESLKGKKVIHRVVRTEEEAEKYWVMRRESFNLLRQHVKGKKTAPFIEDFCVEPRHLPEFLPKALKILKDAKIAVNLAGHAGNGNFHIIPLMNLKDPNERAKIAPVSDAFYDLVLEYGGSITAEHNDGIIRTPYLRKMYGEEIYDLFRQIKKIFDPENIFNPGKKVDGTVKFMKEHIAED